MKARYNTKGKAACIALILILQGSSALFSQGFQKPSPGNSVVYFVRTETAGYAGILYFDDEKCIGELSGKEYFRYECVPGKHLFWTYAKYKQQFVPADLKEGETYIINYRIVNEFFGVLAAQVEFCPVVPGNEKLFEKCTKMISKKHPLIISKEHCEKTTGKMKGSVNEILEKFNKEGGEEACYFHLSGEMAVPLEAMK
jgi:hypothetical protein